MSGLIVYHVVRDAQPQKEATRASASRWRAVADISAVMRRLIAILLDDDLAPFGAKCFEGKLRRIYS